MMPLDGKTAAALALYQHPGRYAVLIGSGVSSAAQIPTGWAITIDLIKRWAKVEGEGAQCMPDPESWYREKTGKEPDYSDLLELMAPTPDERQSLLREYFEPGSEEDRQEAKRVPTAAHHALARLVATGSLRVIVTTNFDRLLEEALNAAGVHPNVIASEDAVAGMVPLNHGEPTVIKIHGDYRSTDLRNTPSELAEYPEALAGVLDEIFERYGLIVCGWSADWDAALRSSITRSTRHRYQTIWMERGEPADVARSLINHRQATIVSIDNADIAFSALADKVELLRDGRECDPLTPELALQAAKKYVADPVHRVRLHDLLSQETEAVRNSISPEALSWSGPTDADAWRIRLERIESACARLVPMAAAVAYYGDDSQQSLIRRAVRRLLTYDRETRQFDAPLESASRYAASLMAYSAGISSLVSSSQAHWAQLLACTVQRSRHEDEKPLAQLVSSMSVLNGYHMQPLLKPRPEDPDRKTPSSEWMAKRLWPMLQPVVFDEGEFVSAFDEWEMYIALDCASRSRAILYGAFIWRNNRDRRTASGENRLVQKVREQLSHCGAQHPLVSSGTFKNVDEAIAALDHIANTLVDKLL